MNMKGPLKDSLKDLLFMLILSSFCAFLLLATRSAVGERAELSAGTADAILKIIGKEVLPSDDQLIESFSEIFVRRQSGKIKFWRAVDKPDFWACEASGNGMWSEITLAFVIDTTTWQIMGLRIVEQNETAGLGSRISEDRFVEQFTGLYGENGVEMASYKIMNNQFDAITGATSSSKSVEKLLNKALSMLRERVKAGDTNQNELS
ncbi:MAG: FMN-binding protein [Pusillimonas sp.]